jgi:hypothetical protein
MEGDKGRAVVPQGTEAATVWRAGLTFTALRGINNVPRVRGAIHNGGREAI